MKAFCACYLTSAITLVIIKAFNLVDLGWLCALTPAIVFVIICIVGSLIKRLDK